MKIRKFIFKFIDHDNKTMRIIEFDVHSSKISEWTQNENDIEGFVQWMSQHARWEMMLKNHIKSIVQDKVLAVENRNFGDYRIVKQKIKKDIVNVNLSNQTSDENRFRQVKLMEKYVTKYERGAKPNNWSDILDYKVTNEHYIYFLADDMSDRIDLRPLRQEGDKIVVPQSNNGTSATKINNNNNNNIMNVRNNTAATNTFSRNVANINTGVTGATTGNNTILPYIPTGRPGYTTGTNMATAVRTNNVLNRNIGTAAINTANTIANTLVGQTGGDDDYQDKYTKYKKKYIELKNNKIVY